MLKAVTVPLTRTELILSALAPTANLSHLRIVVHATGIEPVLLFRVMEALSHLAQRAYSWQCLPATAGLEPAFVRLSHPSTLYQLAYVTAETLPRWGGIRESNPLASWVTAKSLTVWVIPPW